MIYEPESMDNTPFLFGYIVVNEKNWEVLASADNYNEAVEYMRKHPDKAHIEVYRWLDVQKGDNNG